MFVAVCDYSFRYSHGRFCFISAVCDSNPFEIADNSEEGKQQSVSDKPVTGTQEEQDNSDPPVNRAPDRQAHREQELSSEATEDEQAANSIAECPTSQVKAAAVARASRMPKAPSYTKSRKAGVRSEKRGEAEEEEESAAKEVPFQDDPSDADYTPSEWHTVCLPSVLHFFSDVCRYFIYFFCYDMRSLHMKHLFLFLQMSHTNRLLPNPISALVGAG